LLNGEKVASVKQLPPTITFKYNLKNSTGFTPYIGVGGSAFLAWDEQTTGGLTDLSVKKTLVLQVSWF
jgi:outer membrane protein